MNNIPQDLNWVKVRAACSVATVFSELFHGIQQDVQEANQLEQETFPGYPKVEKFFVKPNELGNFFVVWENGNPLTEVKFRRDKDRIVVSGYKFGTDITLTLDDMGRCKLRVNTEDEALEQWQVRKRLLEALFFGGVMPSVPQKLTDQP